MSKKSSKLDTEIDAGKFILVTFYTIVGIGILIFIIWFYSNVYNPKEKAYIAASRYAYKIFHQEMMSFYEKKGYVFSETDSSDNEFCKEMISKYAKNKSGTCIDSNPLMPVHNFNFKNKKISVYGLEKPPYLYSGSFVKDIIIDTNTEKEGDNQVGVDRTILRIYSSGRIPAMITPVNCSSQDETEYGFKKSNYCIGSQEIDYLITNKPLGFDIAQTSEEDNIVRTIGKNISFARADCSAFDGNITEADEYCSDKMYYELRGCDDEYTCDIVLTKY